MSGLSGWCSPGWGLCESPRAHATCQDRIDRGLIDDCDCLQGHEKPTVERDSTPERLGDSPEMRDNGRAKSDPARLEPPGSWPNSSEESDVTQSTRTQPLPPRGRG